MTFIVFEGLDGAGKTTLINKLLPKIKNAYYLKGLNSNTLAGYISKKHTNSHTLLFEIIYLTFFKILPLKNSKTILQDRYIESLQSYNKKSNKNLLIKAIKYILPKPDLYIYLTVNKKDRIKRLKLKPPNIHHNQLINNPNLIAERENLYRNLFNTHKCNKLIINTYNHSKKESIEMIYKAINQLQNKKGNTCQNQNLIAKKPSSVNVVGTVVTYVNQN